MSNSLRIFGVTESLFQRDFSFFKSISRVVIRWNVQRGVAVIPKSVKKERIIENFNIWDFALTEDEMEQIVQLDMGYTEAEDPTSLETALGANQWKIHD